MNFHKLDNMLPFVIEDGGIVIKRRLKVIHDHRDPEALVVVDIPLSRSLSREDLPLYGYANKGKDVFRITSHDGIIVMEVVSGREGKTDKIVITDGCDIAEAICDVMVKYTDEVTLSYRSAVEDMLWSCLSER